MEKIILAAMTEKRVIGCEGRLPWHIPEELQAFRRLTLGHTVVMGRRTFQSIGKPLPGRTNIVVSATLSTGHGFRVCRSFEEALREAEGTKKRIFFIGGAEVFRKSLAVADAMIISWIREDFTGDTFFPEVDLERWKEVEGRDFDDFRLVVYRRRDFSPPGGEIWTLLSDF